MVALGSNFNDFLENHLLNFVQFKQYRGKSGPRLSRVILFKARFFSFRYCEYKQFKQ